MSNTSNLFTEKEKKKMLFIFNAIREGWTVRELSPNKYEFKKNKSNIVGEINLEEYLNKLSDTSTIEDYLAS